MAMNADLSREKWIITQSIFRFYLLSPPFFVAKRSRETCIKTFLLASSPMRERGGSVSAENGNDRFPSIISLR